MTADIRTAAQREADEITRHEEARDFRYLFVAGAVWGAARVTPTREQIAKAIFMTDYEHMGPEAWEAARLDGNDDRKDAYVKADAVLALLQAQAGRDGT